ncbi:MAG: GBS Bsp-like repeat-containing protein [Lachnospiraceae bacterium]|nr:GBS Bsp-like repeat-containing protein [Lachnospiraceae bacterium]
MRKNRKLLSMFLVIVLLLLSGAQVFATEVFVLEENHESTVPVEKLKAFEFVYIDETVIYVPEEQNIAVIFADETLRVTAASLHLRSLFTGEETIVDASNIVGNSVLFTIMYGDDAVADHLILEQIVYQVEQMESDISVYFAAQAIEAGYVVTHETKPQVGEVEQAGADVTIHTVDALGELVSEEANMEDIPEIIGDIIENADIEIEAYPLNDLTSEKDASALSAAFDFLKTTFVGIETNASTSNTIIVISAGHCATHTGAAANGLLEHQLTFQVAQYTKQELDKYGGVTVYTDRPTIHCRYPGQTMAYCVSQRVRDAKALGASVYVDIHFNAGGGTGAEVYYPNNSYSQTIHQSGLALANQILSQLSALGLVNRGAKIRNNTLGQTDAQGNSADFYTSNALAKELGMVGIIVENAFVDNQADVARLRDETFLQDLGVAIAKGIANTYSLGESSNVSPPTLARANIRNTDSFAGTFQVHLSGMPATGANVAVWAEIGGQDDLKWYSVSGTSAVLTINSSNHMDQKGLYHIHVYSRQGAFLCGAAARIATNTMANVSTISRDGENTVEVQVSFPVTGNEITRVQVPVWASSDQRDIVWYNATRDHNGMWTARVHIGSHRLSGRYTAHVYATNTNGITRFVGGRTFTIQQPSVRTIAINNYNRNAGTYDVVLSGIHAVSGVNSVRIANWSKADQSDLIWYQATRQQDGSYRATVSIARHGFNVGRYHAHAYLTTNNGMTVFRGTSHMVFSPSVVIAAADRANTETLYELSAANVAMLGTVSRVRFAVWSNQGGQSDLNWYAGTRNGNGAWVATADIRKHKTAGLYHVHAYATVNGGTERFIGGTSFRVSGIPMGRLTVDNVNGDTGAFRIVISNVNHPSGITKVQLPVWSRANQSDIVWYDAIRQSNGSYRVDVNPSNHNMNSGIYIAHLYVTTGNGMVAFAGGMQRNVKAPDLYSIMGSTQTTAAQLVRYYRARSPIAYPAAELGRGGAPTLEIFAQMYIEEARIEGVRAEVAFAQAMKETGFLRYGGIVQISQYNFCGLGALDGNAVGEAASFRDVRTGIRAQIHHLKAYASTEALVNSNESPRAIYVTRGMAPYVNWLGLGENPNYPTRGWATDPNYGKSIVNDYIKVLLTF